MTMIMPYCVSDIISPVMYQLKLIIFNIVTKRQYFDNKYKFNSYINFRFKLFYKLCSFEIKYLISCQLQLKTDQKELLRMYYRK